MKRIILSVFVFFLISTMGQVEHFSISDPETFSLTSTVFAQAGPLRGNHGPQNYFFKGALVIGVFVGIWLIFYYLLYPHLLKYFNPAYSKSLFWSITVLYFIAWTTLIVYLVFPVGFEYPWMKFVFAFLGALMLIWLIIVMVRKEKAY